MIQVQIYNIMLKNVIKIQTVNNLKLVNKYKIILNKLRNKLEFVYQYNIYNIIKIHIRMINI